MGGRVRSSQACGEGLLGSALMTLLSSCYGSRVGDRVRCVDRTGEIARVVIIIAIRPGISSIAILLFIVIVITTTISIVVRSTNTNTYRLRTRGQSNSRHDFGVPVVRIIAFWEVI